MSRFSQFVEAYGLTLDDFEFDEDGDVVLTESGQEKVGNLKADPPQLPSRRYDLFDGQYHDE